MCHGPEPYRILIIVAYLPPSRSWNLSHLPYSLSSFSVSSFLCRGANDIVANAKDRMGHQIHQMYTARRIQRYEQLYGWRPLKFRIEAFVNGFVDLVRYSFRPPLSDII